MSLSQNKLTFESENLVVDYITLNFKKGKNKIEPIAQKFHSSYGFDCYWVDQENKFTKKQNYLVTNKDYHLTFVFHTNSYNRNTILIQFSGKNASHFYAILKTIKTDEFFWEMFEKSDLTIGRIDLCYIRQKEIKHDQYLDLRNFMKASFEKYYKRYPNSISQPILQNGFGLGTRTGDYFFRIYKTENDYLKFELEIKKRKAKDYSIYFFNLNQSFLEFESLMIQRFYQYLKIGLVLDTEYTDWLVYKLRETQKPRQHLVSSYLKNTVELQQASSIDQIDFYRILQFLSFSRKYSFQTQTVNSQIYYTISFPLIDFAKEIGFNKANYNNYQRQKLVKFFRKLQSFPPFLEWFSDSNFKSALVFPVIRIENKSSQYSKLIIHVSVAKEFYDIKYPFHFPTDFFHFENKDDFSVKLSILQSVSNTNSTRKEFYLQKFLNTKITINNQRQSFIKKNILQQFQKLQKQSFIEKELKLYQKDKTIIETNKLTTQLIQTTQIIIFYEII